MQQFPYQFFFFLLVCGTFKRAILSSLVILETFTAIFAFLLMTFVFSVISISTRITTKFRICSFCIMVFTTIHTNDMIHISTISFNLVVGHALGCYRIARAFLIPIIPHKPLM